MLVVEYLTYEDVLLIHTKTIQRHGGLSGVRDTSAFYSAVDQPHQSFGGADLYPSIEDKAAALGYSLIRNHAFIDGNKRTGFAAMAAFLTINGYTLTVDDDAGEDFVLCVASGDVSRNDLAQWIRDHAEPLP